jgi:hypothetical protein
MAKDYDGKATFHPNGHAEVKMRSIVHGHSTVNPQGTTLMSGEDLAKRASKEHGKGKVAGNIVHFKEEVELDEAFINGREYASHGLMHPDHAASAVHKVTGNTVDFYAHGSGDKVSGKVTKNDGKAVHIKDASGKTHQFKVTPHLPKQQNEETAPWETEAEAKARKASSNFKKPSNPNRTGMDTARALAQKAMKQKMKEEFGLDITDEQADSLLEMSHAPVAPVPDRKYIKGTPENKALKASRKPINGIPTGKYKEDIDFNDEGTLMTKTVSYKEFLEINEIKLADLPSRIVRGTSY